MTRHARNVRSLFLECVGAIASARFSRQRRKTISMLGVRAHREPTLNQRANISGERRQQNRGSIWRKMV